MYKALKFFLMLSILNLGVLAHFAESNQRTPTELTQEQKEVLANQKLAEFRAQNPWLAGFSDKSLQVMGVLFKLGLDSKQAKRCDIVYFEGFPGKKSWIPFVKNQPPVPDGYYVMIAAKDGKMLATHIDPKPIENQEELFQTLITYVGQGLCSLPAKELAGFCEIEPTGSGQVFLKRNGKRFSRNFDGADDSSMLQHMKFFTLSVTAQMCQPNEMLALYNLIMSDPAKQRVLSEMVTQGLL